MRKCKECGVDISKRGNVSVRCENCQKKYRKNYKNRHNKIFKTHKPKSADWKYNFYKMIKNLTDDEIMCLIQTYRERLKYGKKEEIQGFKRKLKILTEEYSKQPRREKAVQDKIEYWSGEIAESPTIKEEDEDS